MTGKQQLLFAVLCLGLVLAAVALPTQNHHKQHQQRHARVASGHRAHRALEVDGVQASNTEFISNGGNAWAVRVIADIKVKNKVIVSSGAVLKAFASDEDRNAAHNALVPLKDARFDFVASLVNAKLKIDGPCVHVPPAFSSMERQNCFYMVMENGGSTDMERCIKNPDRGLNKATFKKFLQRLMGHLGEFHSKGWYHRDLQLKNIMVSSCLGTSSLIHFIDNDLVEHIPNEQDAVVLAKFGYMFRDIQTIFGLGYSGASTLPGLFKEAPLAVKNEMRTSIANLQEAVSTAYETAFKAELQKLIEATSGTEKDGLEKLGSDVWVASVGEVLAKAATYKQLLGMVAKVEKAVTAVVDAW